MPSHQFYTVAGLQKVDERWVLESIAKGMYSIASWIVFISLNLQMVQMFSLQKRL